MPNKSVLVEIPIIDQDVEAIDIPINTSAYKSNKLGVNSVKRIWKSFPKLLIVILLLEVISIYGLLFFITPNTAQPAAANLPSENIVTSDRLIALTNDLRLDNNLKPLVQNEYLIKAAENKAKYILENNNFDHTGLNGESFSYWIKETDYNYIRVGENLAINFDNSDDLIQAWIDSPTHRKNLFNPLYDEIGIATVTGNFKGKRTTVVVQIFGSPE